jgi:hypothetical protein
VSITAVARGCPLLTTLDVNYTGGAITDASITAVARSCPKLTTLDVSSIYGAITDASITAVARSCPQLTTLDVSGTGGAITDVSITAVAQCCPQLTTLHVSYTDGAITDASITAVARGCPLLTTLSAMTAASLSDVRHYLAAAGQVVPRMRPLHATPRSPRSPSHAPDIDSEVVQAPCPKSHRAEQPTGVDGDEEDADTQPFSSSSSITSGDSVDAG